MTDKLKQRLIDFLPAQVFDWFQFHEKELTDQYDLIVFYRSKKDKKTTLNYFSFVKEEGDYSWYCNGENLATGVKYNENDWYYENMLFIALDYDEINRRVQSAITNTCTSYNHHRINLKSYYSQEEMYEALHEPRENRYT